MGNIAQLSRKVLLKIPDADRQEVEELSILLDKTQDMALLGASATGSPTMPIATPPPSGNPQYFRLSGEAHDASMIYNAGMFWYSDNLSTLVTQIDNAGYIFNEQGSDIDFRIEGDTDTQLFNLDAGSDVIGIGGAVDASYKLKITGATAIDGDLTFIGAQSILTSADNLTLNPGGLLTFSKGLSGNWDAGGFEIRSNTFQSDVATTTAPFIVASTTVVTNLNADLLDGSHASAFVLHSLADAANDFLVASGADTFVKKTLAETGAILEADLDHGNIQGLGDDDHTQYILHSLAGAANDFLVASGANTYVKKTLAETGAILEGDIDHGNIQGLDTGADHSYIDQDVKVAASPTFAGLTLDGNQIIDNTATEALLVRKDSDGGDVFIVDTTNGRVTLIGSEQSAAYSIDTYGTGENSQQLFKRARGTLASPSAVQSGDTLGTLGFRGYHSGGAFASSSKVGVFAFASENWTATEQGAYLRFSTTETGGTATTTKLHIGDDGRIGMNTASPNASAYLHVAIDTGIISNGIANVGIVLERNESAALSIITPNNKVGYVNFGDPQDSNIGRIFYDHSTNYMRFDINAGEAMRINSSKKMGIGGDPPTNATLLTVEDGITFKESTAPTADAGYVKLWSTTDNELFFQTGDGNTHLLHGDAFSNIWFHGSTTGSLTVEVAISTQNAFAKVNSFTVVGHEDDIANVVGSSANDNLTLSSTAGGEYEISFHASMTATGGADKEMVVALGITYATAKDITDVTDDTVTPIVITSTAHGLEDGEMVEIVGVLGNTAANGSFIVDGKTDNTFKIVKLDGTATTGNGDFDAGSPTGDITIEYPGNMTVHRMVRGADLGALSATGLHVLANSDVLSLYVANLDGTTNLTVGAVSLDAFRIGD